jgi:hypothetical protein
MHLFAGFASPLKVTRCHNHLKQRRISGDSLPFQAVNRRQRTNPRHLTAIVK